MCCMPQTRWQHNELQAGQKAVCDLQMSLHVSHTKPKIAAGLLPKGMGLLSAASYQNTSGLTISCT